MNRSRQRAVTTKSARSAYEMQRETLFSSLNSAMIFRNISQFQLHPPRVVILLGDLSARPGNQRLDDSPPSLSVSSPLGIPDRSLLHSETLTPGPRNITLDNKLRSSNCETAILSRCEDTIARRIDRFVIDTARPHRPWDPISQLHVYLNDNLRASHLIRRRSSGHLPSPARSFSSSSSTSRAGRDNDAGIYVRTIEEPRIRAYEGVIIPFGLFLRQYSARVQLLFMLQRIAT